MCLICNNNSKILQIGSYYKCDHCKTRIAKVLPNTPKVQNVLEEHAKSYILGTKEIFDIPTYTARLEALRKYTKGAKIVLDFGCGNGNFVKFLQSKNYNALGYDKSANITEHLALQKTPLYRNEKDIPNFYFDMITCFDVIEHTTNPAEIVETLHKKLKKGGILLITTPNAESISSRALGKYWWVFGSTAHFVLFSIFSLKLLLTSFNFNILDVSTDTLTPWFVPSEKFLSKILNKIVYVALLPFMKSLFRNGLGDNIQVIARK